MTNFPSLKNQLLIAMPNLHDENFSQSVTYICEHSEEGAMGIILNKPSLLTLGDVLEHMNITPTVDVPQFVHIGGPVQNERGFILHSPSESEDWASTLEVTDTISLSTSKDLLEAMAHGNGPDKAFLALGYAGWGEGQLEKEILDNAWLSGPATDEIIFDIPSEQRWQAAAQLLGVDLSTISGQAGHA